MTRAHQQGFSLVELMIAILLASITAVVVLNVLTSYQSRSNSMVGRNDAEISAAISLYAVEKDIRMAGAGLTTPRGPLCNVGVNIAWNSAVVSNGAPLMPVRIIDGGAGPDRIQLMRSDSDFGSAPTRLVALMASATSQLSVDAGVGLRSGDQVMVGASDGSKLCTLMQMSAAPTANGSGWLLNHASGGTNYNPTDPTATFTTAVSYDVRDNVVNMGTYGVRRYGIVCSDGAAPAATNNCDLAWWNPLDVATPALNNVKVSSVSPQIVDLQAQYGVSATPNSATVTEWVDATGATWAAPADINTVRRIKAIRISIVTRGSREGNALPLTSVLLWQDDPADVSTARTRSLTTAEQRFRYQALTVVIPLVNAIWTGT